MSRAPGAAGIAVIGSAALARRVGSLGHEVVRLPRVAAADGPLPAAPRLLVIEASGPRARGPAPVETLRTVRSRWPLADALVVAPGGSAALVRDLLQDGARDVILSDEGPALEKAIATLLERQRILPLVDELAERRVRSPRFEGMLSRSHALWDVFETCIRVAPTDANVLLCGETGTGKELLARALHRRSRRQGRFVAVNCSSLPESLLESELFGHEKGAFTGATRAHRGIFREADGGTVLLDEIGDMSPSAQQSLLRVLEERRVRPVGAGQEIDVDVRVVAATHVDLERAVAAGTFREDLFYRLDVIRLTIPPLRERPEDIVYLFGYFVRSLARHYGMEQPRPDEGFLRRLAEHDWPGNVRELENFSERVVLRGRRTLGARDFARFLRSEPPAAVARAASALPPLDTTRTLDANLAPAVEVLERRYLEALLQETSGHVQETARRAGISRRTLQRKLGALGIDKARFRSS